MSLISAFLKQTIYMGMPDDSVCNPAATANQHVSVSSRGSAGVESFSSLEPGPRNEPVQQRRDNVGRSTGLK